MWRVRNTRAATAQLCHIADASGVWFRHNVGPAPQKPDPGAYGGF